MGLCKNESKHITKYLMYGNARMTFVEFVLQSLPQLLPQLHLQMKLQHLFPAQVISS